MENSKQTQKAGENSQQYQIGTIIVNQGITEERAREIYSEMIPSSLKDYTSDAYALAKILIYKNKLQRTLRNCGIAMIHYIKCAFGGKAYQTHFS